jgi:hypothetical protein
MTYDAGRKCALGINDNDGVTRVLKLEDPVGPTQFPSFCEGVREVVDAFERWDKKQT